MPRSVSSTVLTLVVIPAIYAVVKGWRLSASGQNGGVLMGLAHGSAR